MREVARRDALYEPHAVAGAVERPAISSHGGGIHAQYGRSPMPGADLRGGGFVATPVYDCAKIPVPKYKRT